jgi:hypothetical protein
MRVSPTFNDYQTKILLGMSIELGNIAPCATLKLMWSEKIKSLSEEDKKRYLKLASEPK